MSPGAAAAEFGQYVRWEVENIRTEVRGACLEGAKELRNAALQVLQGPSPSAPGSPPGVRSGDLRRNWSIRRTWTTESGGVEFIAIRSGMIYSGFLETGTSKMAARPYVEKVKETAEPKIVEIFMRIGE